MTPRLRSLLRQRPEPRQSPRRRPSGLRGPSGRLLRRSWKSSSLATAPASLRCSVPSVEPRGWARTPGQRWPTPSRASG
eukprot:5771859-Alexandrium_andersonii.AAC.1